MNATIGAYPILIDTRTWPVIYGYPYLIYTVNYDDELLFLNTAHVKDIRLVKPIATIAAIAALAIAYVWLSARHKHATPTEPAAPGQQVSRIESLRGNFKPDAAMPVVTNYTHPQRPFLAAHKADLSAEEIEQLKWVERERFKPAIRKWSQAYAGRPPFDPQTVTLDNLHSRIGDIPGRYIYTFMVDGSTLSLQEHEGQYAVMYLSAPDAPKLSEVRAGRVPIVAVPVTKAEIIAMVKADVGEKFPAEQITIKPTGLACAVNGGTFVDAGWLFPNDKDNAMRVVNFVIGPDGKLISYCSTPFYRSGQSHTSLGKTIAP